MITIGAPEYWHFLRNPSDIDSDLHDGFFLSLGVAGGALGLAGGLAAAPFIAAFAGSASSFSIPTLGTIVTPSGTVMLGITGGTTVTVTGSQAMTAAGMMSAALFSYRDELISELKKAQGERDELIGHWRGYKDLAEKFGESQNWKLYNDLTKMAGRLEEQIDELGVVAKALLKVILHIK